MLAVKPSGVRADAADHLGQQAMHEIEVMDHQIEHDADVGAPTSPWTKPPAIHVPRALGKIQKPRVGKDEALLMTDGENTAYLVRECDQLVGLVEVGRDRLFDEDVGSRVEERTNDFCMGGRGRAHTNEVDLAQQIAPVGNGTHALGDLEMPA